MQANQFLQKPHNLNNLWLKSIAPITLLKQFLQLQTLPTKQLQHEDSSFQPLLKRSTQNKCSLWGAGNGSARRSSRSRLLALKIKPSPLHTKHWPASGNLIFSLFLHTAAILFFLVRFLSFAASSLHKEAQTEVMQPEVMNFIAPKAQTMVWAQVTWLVQEPSCMPILWNVPFPGNAHQSSGGGPISLILRLSLMLVNFHDGTSLTEELN